MCRCSNVGPTRDTSAVTERVVFLSISCYRDCRSFISAKDHISCYGEGILLKPRVFILEHSRMKLSTFRIFCIETFVHPSSEMTPSTSARRGLSHSGWEAR